MSQLKVDTITDEEGTGAPNFSNGVALSGTPLSGVASEAEAEAGTDNETLMTPLRTAQAIEELSPAPSELTEAQAEDPASTVFGTVSGQRLNQSVVANVGGATAGLAFGAVGTYAFLVSNATDKRTLVPGDTVLGSSVRFGGVNRFGAFSATANNVSLENGNETGLNINTAVTVVGTWRMMGNPRSIDASRGFGTIALRIA